MQQRIGQKNQKNMENYLNQLFEQILALAIEFKEKEKLEESSEKARILVGIYAQIIDLLSAAKKEAKSDQDRKLVEEIIGLVPSLEQLLALFLAIERPRTSTSELSKFDANVRTCLTKLLTKQMIDKEKIQLNKRLDKIIKKLNVDVHV